MIGGCRCVNRAKTTRATLDDFLLDYRLILIGLIPCSSLAREGSVLEGEEVKVCCCLWSFVCTGVLSISAYQHFIN